MKKYLYQAIRIFAYLIITFSYTNHGFNIIPLIILFTLIEINVWSNYFEKTRKTKSKIVINDDIKEIKQDIIKIINRK